MPAGYVPLPAARMPDNAVLNFEPVNRIIDSARNWAIQEDNAMLRHRADARAEQDQSRQNTAFAQSQADREIQMAGRRALAAYNEKDPVRRKRIWDGALAAHPNPKGLGPEYLDSMTGPELALAEAGLLPNPLEEQEKRARLGLIDAQTSSARSEAADRSRKAQFDEQILGMINGSGGGPNAAPAAPQDAPPPATYRPRSYQGITGQPILQGASAQPPMSYPPQRNAMLDTVDMSPNGGWPGSPTPNHARQSSGPSAAGPSRNAMLSPPQQMNPGVILAQNAPAQPQPTPAPQRPQGAMDGLSPQQRQAFGLGLMGKGDAGKILLDAANANKLDKSAQTEVDKAEINATNGLARINEINASFDPSYLTYQTQAGMWGRAFLDKTGRLKPEDQSKLYKFATFRRDAARNINDAIKANSGATVTEQELQRNMVELPNAGSGMFDGDSPTEFKAKLDRARETLTLAVARFRYLRKSGFTGAPWESGLELQQMKGLINQRAEAIMGELKTQNPQASPAMLEQEADLRVKQEFGI